MDRLRLIINADDLGANRQTNDVIFDLMNRGKITSAAMFANAPATEEAVALSRKFPRCSFGIHLDLDDFPPLTGKAGDAPLLKNSRHVPAALRQRVFDELLAQVQRLRQLGLEISHMDSHHHIHTIPSMLGILRRLARVTGLRRVRISKTLYPAQHRASCVLLAKKAVYNRALRWCLGARTAEAFGGFEAFLESAKAGRLRCGTAEAMVHPGGGERYKAETALLETAWQEELPFSVELINYTQL